MVFHQIIGIVLLSCIGLSKTDENDLFRYELGNDYPLAQCNDGSKAVFYHSTDRSQLKNIIIHLRGGGLCIDEITCASRCEEEPFLCTANTEPSIDVSNYGILRNEPEINPAFYDYFKVYVHYCSSDLYIGNKTQPDMIFRGKSIVEAVFSALKKDFELNNADTIILTGASAGGMGTYINCDFIGEMVPSSANYRCIPDSVTFVPTELGPGEEGCLTFDEPAIIPAIVDYWGAVLDESCMANANPADPYRDCIMASVAWRYIENPFFFIQPQFDPFFYPFFCPPDSSPDFEDYMEEYGVQTLVEAQRLIEERPSAGGYMPSCEVHVLSDKLYEYYQLTTGPERLTLAQALDNWMKGSGPIYAWDDCSPLACNPGCK